MAERRIVFVTGGTGYMGQCLIARLVEHGHQVRALVRAGSEGKLPKGCTAVVGNALDQTTFADKIATADAFVQLVGVPHPSPSKGAQFRAIDFVSVRESVAAAVTARVHHFVYVSVAHPAPMMKDYIAVRTEGEAMIRASGMNATILRPWYVLGPGHWWPYAVAPFYWICERLPATREGAQRLGLVTLQQMVAALLQAVESPVTGTRVLEVPQIRSGG